jgi:predicted AlkP superfamily pyrophosphatase or phosphodiesterase
VRSSERDNAPEQRDKSYVVLVGLDGFRSDYTTKYHASRLEALGKQGVHTLLTPAFPSTTFPSFYSIVTGLYPEHHGIVAEAFYDPERRRSFHYSSDDAADGSWDGGFLSGCWRNVRGCGRRVLAKQIVRP